MEDLNLGQHAVASSNITMVSVITPFARQRDLLHRHRCFGLFNKQDIVRFDREVLEVLSVCVDAKVVPFFEFQQLVNQAINRAMKFNALPSRPNKRPKERILDNRKKRLAVSQFLRGRKEGGTVENVAATVGENAGVDAKTIGRWVEKAESEMRTPSTETASVTPEQVASEMGINSDLLPALGTPWVLRVVEHGPVNRPLSVSAEGCPWITPDDGVNL